MNANKFLRGVGRWPHWMPRIPKNRDSRNPDLTDLKPEDLEKRFLRNLECPVCLEYMTPPIHLCENGHNICNSCKPNLDMCPNCRHPLLQARNYAMEDLCYKLNYPCKFREEGCEETFSGEHIKQHQAVCRHGIHSCPLGIVPEIDCAWSGEFSELVPHLKIQHDDRIRSESRFLSPETNCSASILLVHGEIFLFYKCFQNGKCYCIVQLFGTSARASDFKYKVQLTAENNVEKLSQVNLVRSITEGFDATFRGGHCVRLDDEVFLRFVAGGAMALRVEVSHVKVEKPVEEVQCRARRGVYWPWCNWWR